VLEEVYANQQAKDITVLRNKLELPIPDLKQEINALYPTLKNYTLSQTVIYAADTSMRRDTVTLFTGSFSKPLPAADVVRLQSWLAERIQSDSVMILIR